MVRQHGADAVVLVTDIVGNKRSSNSASSGDVRGFGMVFEKLSRMAGHFNSLEEQWDRANARDAQIVRGTGGSSERAKTPMTTHLALYKSGTPCRWGIPEEGVTHTRQAGLKGEEVPSSPHTSLIVGAYSALCKNSVWRDDCGASHRSHPVHFPG